LDTIKAKMACHRLG